MLSYELTATSSHDLEEENRQLKIKVKKLEDRVAELEKHVAILRRNCPTPMNWIHKCKRFGIQTTLSFMVLIALTTSNCFSLDEAIHEMRTSAPSAQH